MALVAPPIALAMKADLVSSVIRNKKGPPLSEAELGSFVTSQTTIAGPTRPLVYALSSRPIRFDKLIR